MHLEPIDLRVASVRHLPKEGNRSFMFEVITPRFTRQYQATSDDEARAWVSAINNATQGAFEAQPQRSASRSVSQGSPSTPQRDIASALTAKLASSYSHSSHRSNSSAAHPTIAGKAVSRHATVGDRPRGTESKDAQTSHLAERVRGADPANCFCADCGSDAKVDWVSINFGMTLCIECGGIHRSLGTHITKLRSMTLDFKAFTDDVVELILRLGNSMGNAIFETKLDKAERLKPTSTREQRLKSITAKYVDRAYVLNQLGSSFSQFKTPEDMLLTSIKRNDFRNALYAIALRSNPNALDRSRSTHAVFLALAAADPALPSALNSTASTPSSAATTPTKVGSSPGSGPAPRTAFPMAELLLLNGADIPSLPAPIPLSRSALMYLEFKMSQRGDKPRHHQSTKEESGHSSSGGGDRLGPLPTITAGSPGDRERARDGKLVKRRSGGG